jgi:hypothetical protein
MVPVGTGQVNADPDARPAAGPDGENHVPGAGIPATGDAPPT